MDIYDYERAFLKGSNVEVVGLQGRVLRGKCEADFLTMSDDPERIFILQMGVDGLQRMLDKTCHDMFRLIGYRDAYIKEKIAEGNYFKLVVYPHDPVSRLATWENILRMIVDFFPDKKDFYLNNLERLQELSFEKIEKSAEFKFADLQTKQDCRDVFGARYGHLFFTYQNIAYVRYRLYKDIHLRELFKGDGYTYDERGNKLIKEYISPNRTLKYVPHILMDINVDM